MFYGVEIIRLCGYTGNQGLLLSWLNVPMTEDKTKSMALKRGPDDWHIIWC